MLGNHVRLSSYRPYANHVHFPKLVGEHMRPRWLHLAVLLLAALTARAHRMGLSHVELANLARAASRADTSLDSSGILWLEHINMEVGDRESALAFYCGFLGFAEDPSPSFHVNLGSQQLHLGVAEQPHVITGSVGLAVPSLDALRARQPAAAAALKGSRFRVDDHGDALTATCPWGNTYHCFALPSPPSDPAAASLPTMVRKHLGVDDSLAVRGKPGIRFVELRARLGSAGAIGTFYTDVFGCPVHHATVEGFETVTVGAGPGVHLLFRCDGALCEADEQRMSGVHICVYIERFKQAYDTLLCVDARTPPHTSPRPPRSVAL